MKRNQSQPATDWRPPIFASKQFFVRQTENCSQIVQWETVDFSRFAPILHRVLIRQPIAEKGGVHPTDYLQIECGLWMCIYFAATFLGRQIEWTIGKKMWK